MVTLPILSEVKRDWVLINLRISADGSNCTPMLALLGLTSVRLVTGLLLASA